MEGVRGAEVRERFNHIECVYARYILGLVDSHCLLDFFEDLVQVAASSFFHPVSTTKQTRYSKELGGLAGT